MNIPQGYKRTELGIIPEDWKVVNFCEVADNFTGLTYAPENVKNYGTLVLRSSNIQDGFLCYEDNVYVDGINIPDRAKAKAGDILVCVRNGSRNLIGKSALISSKAPKNLAFGAFMTVLRAKNGSHNIFIHQIWQSDYIQRQIKDNLGATINQITNKDISRYIIPMPPIAEQRAIAEALSDVDGLIAALYKKIAKKRLLKQGAMQQLLTGKKRLPGFADEWVDTPIGEGVRFQVGYPFQSQYFTSDRIGKRLVKNRDLKSDDQIVFYNGEYDHKFIVHNGDILIGMDGDFLPYKWDKGIALLNQRVGRLLPTKKWDLSFVMYSLIEPLQKLQDGTGATTVKHLSHNDIEQMVLCIPQNYEEQQAIATILSDMDKEIADLEAQRDKYRLLKSGMMQKLLTGQIRLVKQQAKIVPLGVDVPAVREIPVATHIIAGHIVNRSHKSRGWGRTKLQKSLHLIGYCMQLNLGNEYIRNTAGPDDQQLMNHIDQKFRQYRHVNKVCEKLPDGRTHYSYTPTPMIQDVEMAYEKYPKELREQIDALIDKLNTMDLAGAEAVSTLYAVWNNRIIKQEQITDDLLIADFYAWSTHKADFEEARVRKALNYMRDNNIIPVGWGKYIDKR